MHIPILYEDNDVVVINKPPGVVANRAESVKVETVQDWSEQQTWYGNWTETDEEISSLYKSRSGIAHRLDKDTSGAMLLAKTPTALVELLRQFRDREVHKTYLALVHGKMPAITDTIVLPLGRSFSNRQKFSVDPEGKESETTYTVKQFYEQAPKRLSEKERRSYQGFSLLELQPKTGRTHQIRVHLAHIKHPLVGDQVYSGRKRAKLDALWCPRQFLHAYRLQFTQPLQKREIVIDAPLPKDLETTLALLG